MVGGGGPRKPNEARRRSGRVPLSELESALDMARTFKDQLVTTSPNTNYIVDWHKYREKYRHNRLTVWRQDLEF